MEFFHYPHIQGYRSVVHYALFQDVQNSAEIRRRIIAAASLEGPEGVREREAVNFAFIDARLITGRLHLQTAVHQAILADIEGSLRTKTVHSEILWVLNYTNNITEAIRRHGVSDNCKSLIVVKIASLTETTASEVEKSMKPVVMGDIVSFDNLRTITDYETIKKNHKLGQEPSIRMANGDKERERLIVDDIVVSTVAMKSVMT